MAQRTTKPLIDGILDRVSTIDLAPFIRTAVALTDWLDTQDTDGILSDALLQEIETYLAAHYYSQRDQRYTSRSTGRASGSFQGQWGMGLKNTDYGQQAIALDVTGRLAALAEGKKRMRVSWLGKAADSVRPDTQETP